MTSIDSLIQRAVTNNDTERLRRVRHKKTIFRLAATALIITGCSDVANETKPVTQAPSVQPYIVTEAMTQEQLGTFKPGDTFCYDVGLPILVRSKDTLQPINLENGGVWRASQGNTGKVVRWNTPQEREIMQGMVDASATNVGIVPFNFSWALVTTKDPEGSIVEVFLPFEQSYTNQQGENPDKYFPLAYNTNCSDEGAKGAWREHDPANIQEGFTTSE